MKRITARMARKVHIATAKFLMKLEAAYKNAKKSKLIFGCAVTISSLCALWCAGCSTIPNTMRLSQQDQFLHAGVDAQGMPFVGANLLNLGTMIDHPCQTLTTLSFDGVGTAAVIKWATDAWDKHTASSTASTPPAAVNVSGNQGPTSVTVNYGKKKP